MWLMKPEGNSILKVHILYVAVFWMDTYAKQMVVETLIKMAAVAAELLNNTLQHAEFICYVVKLFQNHVHLSTTSAKNL